MAGAYGAGRLGHGLGGSLLAQAVQMAQVWFRLAEEA